MSTTENTLSHQSYANQTTPLWATAASGQQFTSPSEVVNQLIPPTAEIATIVNNDGTGSFQLNTIPNGTPLNEIKLEGVTNGISLYTNGEPTLTTAPNSTAVLGDLYITSRQTGGTWAFNNNELSYNGVKQLTGDTTFTQLGENTYSDSYGLNVWNVTSSNSTTTIGDDGIEFFTSSGGSNFNQTFSFTSQLVPFVTTGDPARVTANARTPLFPNDAYFNPATGTSLVVSGGVGTPYSVQATRTGGTGTGAGTGFSLQKTSTAFDYLKSIDFPVWLELTMFDPGAYEYNLFVSGYTQAGANEVISDIKNTAGVLSFKAFLNPTPITFVVGDTLRIVYEWVNQSSGQARIMVSKNNQVVAQTLLNGLTIYSAVNPSFYVSVPAPVGFVFNATFNYGRTSPIIASFNDWEWTTGLGGLYGYDNTAIKPAASGSSPNSTTYWSIVYLKDQCVFTSPPIIVDQGVSVTINAYNGSRFGLGTLNIYQNNTTLVYTGIPPSSWSQNNLGTYVSTGSDTLTFMYSGAPNDTLSLQRINLNYNNPVDTLIGGIGKSGTAINLGTADFLITPTIQMTTSNVVVTKPINMSAQAISNVGSFAVSTLNTNTIAPISPATSTQVGNLNLSNSNISNVGTISTANLNPVSSNIVLGGNFNMSNYSISNAGTISTTNLNATTITSTYVDAPNSGALLDIGSNSFSVRIDNADLIAGRSSTYPLNVITLSTINSVPPVWGTIWYTANFDGFKTASTPLLPAPARIDTTMYPISGDSYLGTTGYTLPGRSELTIFDTALNVLEYHENNAEGPVYYPGTQMILNTTSRLYIFKVHFL